MDIQSLMNLLACVEHTGWSVFEVQEDGFSLHLERPAHSALAGGASAFPAPPMSGPNAAPEPAAISQAPIAQAEEVPDSAGTSKIESPLVGIFHALSDKKIESGTHVKKDDPVCTIEAMKLMNEVVMPESGTIKWMAVSEGESVEYGQLLFTYIPD